MRLARPAALAISISSTTRSSSALSMQPIVDIYPPETPIETLASNYRSVKKLHVIRHAQGYHNVNKEYRDIKNLDARLTEKGVDQCRQLARQLSTELASEIDLVVASPMTRCVQTALYTMDPVLSTKPDVPVILHESIRETVNYNCDRKRPLSELLRDFEKHAASLDPTHTTHDDHIWEHYEKRLGDHEEYTTHRESAEIHRVADRAKDFLDWLADRPEKSVVMCSHAAFLRCFWNFGHRNPIPKEVPQVLDTREEKVNHPIVRFGVQDDEFIRSMQDDYENCELRTVIAAFA